MEVKIINKSGLPDPAYATEFSSGMDLCSCSKEDIVIEPLQRLVVKTGIYLEIPEGYEAQIRPRSGMSLKYGITCVNSPGTIDADYRGEIGVILINLSKESYTIKYCDRIAQMVFAPFTKVKFVKTDVLSETVRGEGGYGHTGKNDVNNEQTTVTFKISTDGLCGDYKSILHELMCDYDNKETDETNDCFIPVSDHGYSPEFNDGILFDDETGTVVIDESIKLQPIPTDYWFYTTYDNGVPDFGSKFSYEFTEYDYKRLKEQSFFASYTNYRMYEVVYDKKQEKIMDYSEVDPTTFIKQIDPDSGSIIWIQYPDKQEMRRILNDAQITFNIPGSY